MFPLKIYLTFSEIFRISFWNPNRTSKIQKDPRILEDLWVSFGKPSELLSWIHAEDLCGISAGYPSENFWISPRASVVFSPESSPWFYTEIYVSSSENHPHAPSEHPPKVTSENPTEVSSGISRSFISGILQKFLPGFVFGVSLAVPSENPPGISSENTSGVLAENLPRVTYKNAPEGAPSRNFLGVSLVNPPAIPSKNLPAVCSGNHSGFCFRKTSRNFVWKAQWVSFQNPLGAF